MAPITPSNPASPVTLTLAIDVPESIKLPKPAPANLDILLVATGVDHPTILSELGRFNDLELPAFTRGLVEQNGGRDLLAARKHRAIKAMIKKVHVPFNTYELAFSHPEVGDETVKLAITAPSIRAAALAIRELTRPTFLAQVAELLAESQARGEKLGAISHAAAN